jgi:hypothetical protein
MTLIHLINIPQNIFALFMILYDNIDYFNGFVKVKIFPVEKNISVNMKLLVNSDMYSFNTWDFITVLYNKNLINDDIKRDNILLSKLILEYIINNKNNNYLVEYANFNDKYEQCDQIIDFYNENEISKIIKKLHIISKNYKSIKFIYFIEFINKILLYTICGVFFMLSFLIINYNLLK